MDNIIPEKRSKQLTAKELLEARGIQTKVCQEFELTSSTLPKSGEKLIEPSQSLLENQQINTTLSSQKKIISIEKVNRVSQLALAEWLQDKKLAKVVRKSSTIYWQNYGITICGDIYLIPEEALLLLELNQLELTWENQPLSIQQAYEILIDSSKDSCTLDEYRVFSQLTRVGYHLQRFHYDNMKNEENHQPKKKVIVGPENSNWMGNHQQEIISNIEDEKDVKNVINSMLDTLEEEEKKNINTKKNKSLLKEKGTRVEIVSEETVLDPIKFVRSPLPDKTTTGTSKRIQRNVKLLPKRIDKKLPVKHKNDSLPESSEAKKSKCEIINLSDDEVEVIPTRLEMLNYLPNFASKDSVNQTVPPRNYIPPGIDPDKIVYKFDCEKFKRVEEDSGKNKNEISSNNDNRVERNSNFHQRGYLNRQQYYGRQNNLVNRHNNFLKPRFDNSQFSNINYRHQMQANYSMSRFQMNQNRFNNHSGRWSHYEMNIVKSTMMTFGFVIGASIMENKMRFYYNMMNAAQRMFRVRSENPELICSRPLRQLPSTCSSQNNQEPQKANEEKIVNSKQEIPNQSTFTNLPANSWSELKQKLKEAKTITIYDEDDKIDNSDIEIVGRNIQPLINENSCKEISVVYDKLKIIKVAQEKIVRRKKSDYKISYKVYGNNRVYKKSNPGEPMFHLVVTKENRNFLQPVELNRLQREGKDISILAGVVSPYAITYLQIQATPLPSQIVIPKKFDIK